MDLFVDPTRRRTVAAQLYGQLRDAIEQGRLRAGDRLPPSRQLAGELGIARHTVTTVYGRLNAEGFIEGRSGGGSFVRSAVAGAVTVPSALRLAARRGRLPATSGTSSTNGTDRPSEVPVVHDLGLGSPDPALFPIVEWRRAVTWSLQRPPETAPDAAGDADLRRAIARWIGRSRSVQTDGDHVVVTAGAQQAFDLVGRALLAPGDVVAIEDPGYHLARHCFEAIGASVVPVPVDDEGIVVGAIPIDARVVYTTPSHQMPLGVTMSMERRVALLAHARRHHAAIIEDDYDSEHRFVDRPLEPLHRLDRGQRVVYVGTFSKTLSPALRLGFTVVPDPLLQRIRDLRSAVDWQPPATEQSALHRLMSSGAFDRHLRRVRRVYADRHRAVVERLDAHADVLRVIRSNAGLHVAAWLPPGCRERDVVAAAAERRIRVGGLDTYRMRPSRRGGLAIGFGLISLAQIADALDGVADAVRSVR